MRVALWYNNKDIRIEEVPTPRPGPNEMLVKVISCGICGSDIVEWYRLPRAPLVLGHEIGAEVVEVGQSVKKFNPADRVFIAPKVPCMQCDYCKKEHYPVCTNIKERLPGGFAEYVLVPNTLIENGAYRLPDTISYDQSTFIEPLACVVRAQRLAGVQQGQTVMVFGCGMSGLLHVKLAKAKNCQVIATDLNVRRLELAAGLGADITLDAAENVANQLTAAKNKKVDVVILCTSAVSAVDQAWQWVDKGGVIVFFAVPGPNKQITIPLNDFWTKEIQILTSYYCGPPDIVDAIEFIESGAIKVDDMITHQLPLKDIGTGFQLVMDGRESIKVIIKPNL
ncbi:MAG: alcohol dehydrogenase catalytic domain-containing protein [Deltaproteobacteria bacterium]|jgi:L-iditol 2-dehydrogenase|nr:alcohol dehydrogenase catalytic domain-containing protein [Deltaproteobacteria bacterium]MBW2582078.1 alcohol dehydrogenase catalytic domain-containing protein [Deltaproteobacteria bacterium]